VLPKSSKKVLFEPIQSATEVRPATNITIPKLPSDLTDIDQVADHGMVFLRPNFFAELGPEAHQHAGIHIVSGAYLADCGL